MRILAQTIAAAVTVLAITGQAPAQEATAPADPDNQIVVKETHGDWELRCTPDDSSCFIYQLAKDYKNNPVAELNLVKLPESEPGDAGVTILTPLGTVLPAGLVLRIDSEEPRQYPFAWCDGGGCFSRFPLDTESIALLESGKIMSLTVRAVGVEEPIVLEVSLSGFTAAYKALEPMAAE